MKRFVLLDIDGVLVRPLGYRAALRASLATFAGWMGCADFQVEEEVIGDLEARGISSEFDMLPLLVGALLSAALSEQSMREFPEDLVEAVKSVSIASPLKPEAIHVPLFSLQDDCFPAEAAYRSGLYPGLPETVRRSLLLNTRDVYRSATTRLFQQFVLGSQRFEQVYGLPAQVQSVSYLQEYDQPLLDSLSRKRLERAWRSSTIHIAAMTARPSLPPRGAVTVVEPYPPEAETALELIGWPDLPLIGLGKLEYVARKANLPVENLLKPAPAQALAAILVASGEEELVALEAASAWLSGRAYSSTFDHLPGEFELNIVEDTLGGVRSVRAAAELLRQSGYRVDVRAWGLTEGNRSKRATLEDAGVRCFDTWGELLKEMEI